MPDPLKLKGIQNMSEFILDENGKLADSDPVFDKLDKWLDDEEYDKAIDAVLAVPREKWSNKLHFRLISAYNNKKDFKAALGELDKISPRCETPQDLARFYYMNGYIYFMSDREMLALSMYKLGIEEDPHNTSGLDLEKECRECLGYIEEDLGNLHAASADAVKKLAMRCVERPEKIDVADPDFELQLGWLFSKRVLPGMTGCIDVDNYYKKFGGEEREAVAKMLAETYKITSRESLMEFISNDRYCNLAMMADDVIASMRGKPTFDPDILDKAGREAFDNTMYFVRPFAEFLPRAGVLAWDIDEKMGLVRYAHSCGLLTREDYTASMHALADIAKEKFSSSEEYLRSLLFGCALFAFDTDCWNINGSITFLNNILGLLLGSELPDIKWKKAEKKK